MLATSSSSEIVLIADPRVLSIPIKDNQEKMVDLLHQDIIVYGPSPEILNNTDYTKMRLTVYDKLIQAQNLLPQGLRFCLYEGYRSLSLQKLLFDKRFSEVQERHPQWSKDQLFDETTILVSPVVNKDGSKNIPPHSTGGAVDVYLLDHNGEYVDMGIHPKDWMLDKDGSLSRTDSSYISAQAQANRQMLARVMYEVGFANYPTEYWHWSYGDRYWAYMIQASHAIYGTV